MNQTVKPELKSPEIGNSLIARFMGIKTRVFGDTPTVTHYNFNNTMLTPEKMKYSVSWDWLMPVIEKISKLEIEYRESDGEKFNPYPRTFGMIDEEGRFMFRFNVGILHFGDTLIEAAYAAVVDFLEGYMKLREGGAGE